MRLADEIAVEHWLLKLIEAGDGDIPAILRHYGIDTDTVWDALTAAIDRAPRNLRGKPALSPQLAAALADAWTHASTEGTELSIRSANLLQAIVDAPHVLRARGAWPLLSVSSAQIARLLPRLGDRTCETQSSSDAPPRSVGDSSVAERAATPEAKSPVTNLAAAASVPSQSEALARYAIDLTEKARDGKIDPVLGRDREIQQMVDVLARRRKNNPILVGEPGVGKTALVEGLALRVANGDVPSVILNVRVLTLDLGLLQAGAGVKGEFEQRLKTVIEEVRASSAPVLLFIDEAHTLIGAGNAAGGADAANLLKPALARGELRTIAATTWAEYKEFFERDAALERRFQMIKVDEPDDETACLMLRGLKASYASFHQVHIRDEALVAAVKLSRRYIPARQLPDKAIDLIDTAAARVRMSVDAAPVELQRGVAAVSALEIEQAALAADAAEGIGVAAGRLATIEQALTTARAHVEALTASYAKERRLAAAVLKHREAPPAERDGNALSNACVALAEAQDRVPLVCVDVDAPSIARVVAEWTGIPVGNLVSDEVNRLLSLEARLSARVIGQNEAVGAISESLRAARAGLNAEHAPLGVFLLAGPSGVGKTETALALADGLFGGPAALTTINMSEYQEAHTVSQLKGSPPGYVGYGRGGVLTEAVRQRPYCVLLLDEVEKAHRDVLDMFYQVFDRGSMRDGEGREIDFRNCLILMTSNLGSATIEAITEENPGIMHDALLDAVRPELVAHFQPALLARFQTVLYRPLSGEALRSIVKKKLEKVAARIAAQYGSMFVVDDALVQKIAQDCENFQSGARSIDALMNRQILPSIARELLALAARGDVPRLISLKLADDGRLDIDLVHDGIDCRLPVRASEKNT